MTPTALITGGASGIGYALSEALARRGFALAWVALDAEELERGRRRLDAAVPGVALRAKAQDLAAPGAAEAVWRWATDGHPAPDWLVNNAGFGTYGPLDEQDPTREEAMLACNVTALHGLTRRFLPEFLARDTGTIVHLSSNSALQPVPLLSSYSATKAFVYQFSESLRAELRDRGSRVRVLTVCPAATAGTGFQATAGMQGVRTFDGLATTTPEEVAADILRAAERNQSPLMTGKRFRRLHRIGPLLPAFVHRAVIRRELRRRETP
jgi:short-subunit dehydrogenase